jgi:hypothetical protein
MKKLVILWAMILLFLLPVISVIGCGQQAEPATTPEVILTPEEVLACLTELNSTAVKEINLQVADLDKKIAEVEEKEEKLVEVQAMIKEDMAYLDEIMSDTTVRNNQYYEYIMPEEYLVYYQNDCYELVKFKRQYHYSANFEDGVPWIIFQDTIIMDKASGVKDTPENFERHLAVEKSPYVKEKTAKLEAVEKANTILNDMLQNSDGWEIREEGDEIYSIEGYGLGYTDQLTTGKWLYYLGSKTMEPKSQYSIRLNDILTAKTSA